MPRSTRRSARPEPAADAGRSHPGRPHSRRPGTSPLRTISRSDRPGPSLAGHWKSWVRPRTGRSRMTRNAAFRDEPASSREGPPSVGFQPIYWYGPRLLKAIVSACPIKTRQPQGGVVMAIVTTIGLDLAKNVFQVHGVDNQGNDVLKKKVSRNKVLDFFVNLPPCIVGLEACGGAHYWANEISKFGHNVRQMPPQYVKPYVKTNKNDANDAEAICEAVSRPNMRFVHTKNVEQLDIQAVHRIRSRLVGNRTALANQVRGLLLEVGIALPQGILHLRKQLPRICENLDERLTYLEIDYLSDIYTELVELDEKINKYESIITAFCHQSELCKRIIKIPGVGPLTATAIVAAVGDARNFKNGREFSASLGLVPRQHSSGGKTQLQGISKRGDTYLRMLLIHGARTVVRHSITKQDVNSQWIQGVVARRGIHRAIAAQANKTARKVWAVLAKNEEYRMAA